jgi:hypothetical protein
MNKYTAPLAALTAVLLCAFCIWWLRAAHFPVQAVQVAHSFVLHLEAQRYAQAYALAVPKGVMGRSAEQFEAFAKSQYCGATRIASTFPYQSNGNRLRRWWAGRQVELNEVAVEFEGVPCLLGVKVQRNASGAWRVVRFASHAG